MTQRVCASFKPGCVMMSQKSSHDLYINFILEGERAFVSMCVFDEEKGPKRLREKGREKEKKERKKYI